MRKPPHILLVEDELEYAKGIVDILEIEGYHVTTVNDVPNAILHLEKNIYDLVLTDYMLGDQTGLDLIKRIQSQFYGTKSILMTAYATIENAVESMKLGAVSYYVKGNPIEGLIKDIQEALTKKCIINSPYSPMVKTLNHSYQTALHMALKAAKTPVNILLFGESGAGKEIFANLIHAESERKNKPFVAVNCQALSESVLESELFGHKKGAYTGAMEERIGRFEAADGGTLFLDEIADLPLSIQVKLLRVIETKSIERIGSNENIPVDFRLITATNKDLKERVAAGLFREDFYYRINTIEIEIPPLRERKEDIQPLGEHFIKLASEQMGKSISKIDDQIWELLREYDFKGNVRELKNIMERLVVFSENETLNANQLFLKGSTTHKTPEWEEQTLKDFRNAMEKKYIEIALKKQHHNVTKTATLLGITRRQLQNKMKDFDIQTQKHSEA